MSTRNTSYAHQLDRAASRQAKSQQHANSNQAPSPSSSKTAFDGSKAKHLQAKAQKASQQANQSFAPSPERSPQPRGMGERGVNWQAHIKRAESLRDKVEGAKRRSKKPPAPMIEKAKKAAQEPHAASPSFDKSASR
ncbi:MAG: hypothetical protein AAGL10_06325 [Pseudomonadota bacterium]